MLTCVLLLWYRGTEWNSSETSWDKVKAHLKGEFSTNMDKNINALRGSLTKQSHTLQIISAQNFYDTLVSGFTWLNPKT